MEPPELPGVEHHFLEIAGARHHVAIAGSGPPVLLLHGWPQNWWEWREVIPALAEYHRVIAPDLRGFGWSEATPDGYRKERLADDVLSVLEQTVGDEPVDIAGHDWGGYLVFLLGIREPQRFRRCLVLNTGHPFFLRPSLARLAELRRFWYQGVIAAGEPLRPAVLAWVGAERAGWSPRDREVFLGTLREPARARASALLYRTFLTAEIAPIVGGAYRHARFPLPGLWLHGTADRVLTPALVRGFERQAPELDWEDAPGVGHFIVDERPDLVVDRARALFGD